MSSSVGCVGILRIKGWSGSSPEGKYRYCSDCMSTIQLSHRSWFSNVKINSWNSFHTDVSCWFFLYSSQSHARCLARNFFFPLSCNDVAIIKIEFKLVKLSYEVHLAFSQWADCLFLFFFLLWCFRICMKLQEWKSIKLCLQMHHFYSLLDRYAVWFKLNLPLEYLSFSKKERGFALRRKL